MKDQHLHCYRVGKHFPEIYSWSVEKLKDCLADIYDYTKESLLHIDKVINDIQQLNILQNMPLVRQRSKEWFDLRMNRLTASDLAQALGKGKFGNRKQLLESKAFPANTPLKSLPPLKWGVMFEEMGMRCYQQIVNPVKLYEFGLIPNDEIVCFGASPDGITETGIMVEMKCPYNRKCTSDVPEQYYLQIQGQLATCKLSLCDYVECYFEVYHDISEYMMSCTSMGNKEHGIILEFMNTNNDYIYEYSPECYTTEECIQWANEQVSILLKAEEPNTFIKMTPWRLKHIFHTRVTFDETLWKTIIPSIYDFWKEVEEIRLRGPPAPKPTVASKLKRTLTLGVENTQKYRFIEDSDDEK